MPRSDVTELVESSGTVDPASGFAERLALAEDIARLPRKQRAVIILRYYEDLPDGEIADWLGCAPSTVRAHALRALRTLRVAAGTSNPTSSERTR